MIGIIFLIMVRTNFFLRYFSTQTVRSRYKVKLLFTKSLNIGEITSSGENILFICYQLLLCNYCFTRVKIHKTRNRHRYSY